MEGGGKDGDGGQDLVTTEADPAPWRTDLVWGELAAVAALRSSQRRCQRQRRRAHGDGGGGGWTAVNNTVAGRRQRRYRLLWQRGALAVAMSQRWWSGEARRRPSGVGGSSYGGSDRVYGRKRHGGLGQLAGGMAMAYEQRVIGESEAALRKSTSDGVRPAKREGRGQRTARGARRWRAGAKVRPVVEEAGTAR